MLAPDLTPLAAATLHLGRPPERALEVECEGGDGALFLAREFPLARVRGVDRSEAAVRRATGRVGLDPEGATTMLIYAMIGGIGGSKLYFALDVSMREGIPFTQLLFAREGITFYGGLIGAIAAVIIGTRIHGIPTGKFFNCVCLAGALGQALGRIGCFLVGDDYGRPTDLPWGLSFPVGLPPTTAGELRQMFGVAIPAGVPDNQLLRVQANPAELRAAIQRVAENRKTFFRGMNPDLMRAAGERFGFDRLEFRLRAVRTFAEAPLLLFTAASIEGRLDLSPCCLPPFADPTVQS